MVFAKRNAESLAQVIDVDRQEDEEEEEGEDDDDDVFEEDHDEAPKKSRAKRQRTAEEKLAEKRKECERKQRTITDTQRKLKDAMTMLERAQQEQAKAEERASAACRERDDAKQRASRFARDLNDAKAELNTLRKQHRGAQALLIAGVQLYTQAAEEVDELKKTVTRANKSIERLHDVAFGEFKCVICADRIGLFKIHEPIAAGGGATHWLCEECGPAYAKQICLGTSARECPYCKTALGPAWGLVPGEAEMVREHWMRNYEPATVTADVSDLGVAQRYKAVMQRFHDKYVTPAAPRRPGAPPPPPHPHVDRAYMEHLTCEAILKAIPGLNGSIHDAKRLYDGHALDEPVEGSYEPTSPSYQPTSPSYTPNDG